MPLKVRFRHGSSQRVLDLPDHQVAKPLIIGRGNDVDLRLPFDSIAPQHAALYVKDGVWVIQGMSGVVTLGGKALGGPANLQSGDVIALGSEPSAPTLEIDPKVTSAAASPAGPARPQPAPAPAPARIRPAGPVQEQASQPQVPAEGLGDEGSADGQDTIEWDPQASPPETTEFYVPKGRKTPVLGILVAVILGGGMLAAVGYYAYRKARQPHVIIVRQEPAPVATVPTAPKKNHLFDLNQDEQPEANSRTPVASPIPAAPAATQPATDGGGLQPMPTADPIASKVKAPDDASSKAPPSPAKEETPPDPNDAEWNEIRSAHFNVRHQGVAILKYDEYRREHPGKFTELLDRYTDEAVNWLYWQRVAQLWSRRDDQTAQLRQKTRDIQNQPPGEFHERLVKEKAELQAKADQTKQQLTDEMGYHGDVPPDLESPRTLKQLTESRDPAKFAAFTKRVLHYVRTNHGGVWWDGE